jgi:hypothetical protein
MTWLRLSLLVTAVMTVWLVAGAAAAQSACAPRDAILERLAAKYGEVPVAAGVTDRALLIEVLVSGDGGSWTIIATSPAGASCLIAAGEGWRDVAAKPRGPRT